MTDDRDQTTHASNEEQEMRRDVRSWIDNLRIPEEVILTGSALVVGAASSFARSPVRALFRSIPTN